MIQMTDFRPNDEYLLFRALMAAGILPEENITATWNNPNSSIHIAWNLFNTYRKACLDNTACLDNIGEDNNIQK